MQVLVISDTHLQNELFQKNNQTYPKMDYYLHCGDSSLKKDDFLLNKYYTVKGNHDDEDFPVNIILEIGKYRCLITHGNAYDIYYGNDKIKQYMIANNIDICLDVYKRQGTPITKSASTGASLNNCLPASFLVV